jgi:hypothetical protein
MEDFVEKSARKVLLPMPAPELFDDGEGVCRPLELAVKQRINPLLAIWAPLHPDGLDEPLFFQKFSTRETTYGFAGVWIFSMSNYLRSIRASGVDEISVPMPTLRKRIDWLMRMFTPQTPGKGE